MKSDDTCWVVRSSPRSGASKRARSGVSLGRVRFVFGSRQTQDPVLLNGTGRLADGQPTVVPLSDHDLPTTPFDTYNGATLHPTPRGSVKHPHPFPQRRDSLRRGDFWVVTTASHVYNIPPSPTAIVKKENPGHAQHVRGSGNAAVARYARLYLVPRPLPS